LLIVRRRLRQSAKHITRPAAIPRLQADDFPTLIEDLRAPNAHQLFKLRARTVGAWIFDVPAMKLETVIMSSRIAASAPQG
jgi:hypothetical protein